ncbi:T-complex protein 1 subunit eta [Pteropus alecto]|uniref:T-complex protein 1 subunit eta n=1 Tax=Pteropus alecto TaxID=9402 RepID=L5JPV0_PTEAL|nr:T-complex protein 1 subunit eta [Pteropus alecto]
MDLQTLYSGLWWSPKHLALENSVHRCSDVPDIVPVVSADLSMPRTSHGWCFLGEVCSIAVAKTLVDIAKSQDAEVGYDTTPVTLLTVVFLKQVKPRVEEVCIFRDFFTATQLIVNKIKEIAVTVKKEDKVEQRKLLEKCAMTALSSKLIS